MVGFSAGGIAALDVAARAASPVWAVVAISAAAVDPTALAAPHRPVLLINGDFIPGFSQLDTQGQILAYAIAFGVAQHLVTRFVDQRADDVLSSLPSKEHPVTKEKQSSTETRSAGSENPGS